MNCITENNLRAYRDGELDAVERQAIAAHVESCEQCGKRLREIAATSDRVDGRLKVLAGADGSGNIDAGAALAQFQAQHSSAAHPPAVVATMRPTRTLSRFSRPAWIGAVAATILLLGLAFPSGRSLAQRFLATLRVEKVQPVRLDFSALDGNRPLQEMFSQMLSDKVVVTAKEKSQPADSASSASQLAGFAVKTIAARTDAPAFTVEGQHAFHLTMDRSRLQDILDQAGRGDLALPAAIDGATVSVNIPRSVRLEYGTCPHEHHEAQASSGNSAAPENSSTSNPHSARGANSSEAWANCLALIEAPSPQVNVPADLNIQQLAEIAFQLAGMSDTESRQLAQTIDWKSTLVLPLPRGAGSYSQVQVGGAQGTLINGSSNRGPHYVLLWVKSGIIYGLVGHGDSTDAVALANSLS
jgi:anti-sigma factor RsiW